MATPNRHPGNWRLRVLFYAPDKMVSSCRMVRLNSLIADHDEVFQAWKHVCRGNRYCAFPGDFVLVVISMTAVKELATASPDATHKTMR